jgi:hypothetical protein
MASKRLLAAVVHLLAVRIGFESRLAVASQRHATLLPSCIALANPLQHSLDQASQWLAAWLRHHRRISIGGTASVGIHWFLVLRRLGVSLA